MNYIHNYASLLGVIILASEDDTPAVWIERSDFSNPRVSSFPIIIINDSKKRRGHIPSAFSFFFSTKNCGFIIMHKYEKIRKPRKCVVWKKQANSKGIKKDFNGLKRNKPQGTSFYRPKIFGVSSNRHLLLSALYCIQKFDTAAELL